MKRIASAIFFACLALSLVAQQGIKVKYKGSKPTVTDFAWAAFPSLNYEDEEECGDRPWRALQHAMTLHSKGLPQEQGETLTIDTKTDTSFLRAAMKTLTMSSGWKCVTGTKQTGNTNSSPSTIWQVLPKAVHV
jgi:hypothetical protein